MDWSQKLIKELKNNRLVIDDCTRAFVKAYSKGDSIEAYKEFISTAKIKTFSSGQYFLAIFPDNSAYADWKEGIDRFYPDINDLIEEVD